MADGKVVSVCRGEVVMNEELRKLIAREMNNDPFYRGDIWPSEEPKGVTIREIQKETCRYFGVTMNEILSTRHNRKVVLPRHVGIYLARKFTRASYPVIGKYFRRDHTSTISAVKQVNNRMKFWPEHKRDVEKLETLIKERYRDGNVL